MYPSPVQQWIARDLIDAGADVIIGHHPNVVQGIERYRNGIILYSVGNLNFMNHKLFPCTRWGLIVLLHFDETLLIKYKCIPVTINEEYQPHIPGECGQIFSKVSGLYLGSIGTKNQQMVLVS